MNISLRDQLSIETAALRQFDCEVYLSPQGRNREPRERVKNRRRVNATTAAFFNAMNSSNPPATREEAIRSTIGGLGMLLAFLFPQYAMAITVAGWLWDFLHGEL